MADISQIKLPNNTVLDIKDAVARNSIPTAATAAPKMDGTAAVGSSAKYAKEDHVHPSDTTKLSKAGDSMTGSLTLASNKYYENSNVYGLNAANSDIIGVNGIYTNDAADTGAEGINFYRSAGYWDSLYAKNGKVYFAPNRPSGSAGSDIQQLYSVPNYGTDTSDISIRPYVAFSRANRLAFLPADQIIIEQTTDGGETWESANISDSAKLNLFSTRSGNIAIPKLNGEVSELCGIRITITGMKYNVPDGTTETEKYNYWNSTYIDKTERYCNLRELWFWITTGGNSMRVQVYSAMGANPDNWIVRFNTDFAMAGWSGSDWVRVSPTVFGGSKTQPAHYWNWRMIFWSRIPDNKDAFPYPSNTGVVYGIAGYGDNAWTTPNPLMKEDHLYYWDANQNAFFPAQVNATEGFKGSGANLTNLNASNLASGTVPAARIPVATTSAVGGIKVGTNLSISDGVLSAIDTTYSAATDSAAGLMSADDKIKLDGIATGATANAGTITGITMNGASMGTSGTVNLGTVLTAHQDISGKADKADTVLETTLSRGRLSGSTVGAASFAFGADVTASGQNSHAEGYSTTASNPNAHAEGGTTTASGVNSHAEGAGTTAGGANSHAEGVGTTAGGASAHAEGGGTTASGVSAHAEGGGTIASGSQAHAEGGGTTASGDYSHAEGGSTIANCAYQHVFGLFNAYESASSASDGRGTFVEIVGNGSNDSSRSNARTLDWNGNERLTGTLYVNANSDGTGGTAVLTTHQDISDKANLASPTFTGIPAAPTAASGTSTT